MKAKKINWGEIFKGSDIEVLSTFYAFKSISYILSKRGYDKAGIEGLKLTLDGEQMLAEGGFREFLKSITALSWQDNELSKFDIKALSSINEYLTEPYVQVDEPFKKGVTFEDLIVDVKRQGGKIEEGDNEKRGV